MSQKKRELKDSVTKRDLVIAISIIIFMLTTAILSYFFGDYGVLKYISGGEKLFRFWIIIGLFILCLAWIVRIKERRK